MKILVTLCILFFSITAFAADKSTGDTPPADIAAPATNASGDDGSGYTIGFDLGTGHIHYEPGSYSTYLTNYSGPANHISNRQGFMYDVYVGYRLYRFLGWEMGYMNFSNATFNYNGAPNTMKVKRYDYDFLIRGDILGFGKSVQWPTATIFVKAGAARVNSRFEAQDGNTSNIVAWTPVYGLGASYQFTHFWALNAQWLHTQKVKPAARTAGISTPDVPGTNIFSAGLVYRF